MNNIIIKNIDNDSFDELQRILFENGCVWKSDSYSGIARYKFFYIDDCEMIIVSNRIITLEDEMNEKIKHFNQYNSSDDFIRCIKINKING